MTVIRAKKVWQGRCNHTHEASCNGQVCVPPPQPLTCIDAALTLLNIIY